MISEYAKTGLYDEVIIWFDALKKNGNTLEIEKNSPAYFIAFTQLSKTKTGAELQSLAQEF